MNHKLFILLFFYLCFDLIYTLTSSVPLLIDVDDESKEFKVVGSEIIIITKSEKEGFIGYMLTLSKGHASLSDKIFYTTANSISYDENSFKKTQDLSYNGDSSYYTFTIQVKENQYVVAKITGLNNGENIILRIKYVSNSMALGIIIGSVVVAILILCLICYIVKKCCC